MKKINIVSSLMLSLILISCTLLTVSAEQCFPVGKVKVSVWSELGTQTLNGEISSSGGISIYSNEGQLKGSIDSLGHFKASNDYTTVSGSVSTSCNIEKTPIQKANELSESLNSPLVNGLYGSIPMCTSPYPNGCTNESDYNQINIFAGLYGTTNDGNTQTKLNECRKQIDTYQASVAKYNQCSKDYYGYDPISKTYGATKKEMASQNAAKANFNTGCINSDSNSNYDSTSGTCICIADYRKIGNKCVSNNTYLCLKNSGPNAKMLTSGDCGCESGYYMNENDKCTYGIKPKINLTQNIKTYVDYGNDCFRGVTLSQTELQACVEYKNNPRKYDVTVVNNLNSPNIITNSTSTYVTTDNINTKPQRTLKKGMSGPDVLELQTKLKKLNYLPASHTPSKNFGPVTTNALIKFQKDNKIYPSNGVLGASTQTILINLTN